MDFAERSEGNLDRAEALLAGLEALPDGRARQLARDLMREVLDLHGRALARMTGMLAVSQPATLAAFAADDLVAAVLLLHGLHPESANSRIRRALAGFRGAEVRLLEVEDGVARLRIGVLNVEAAEMLRRDVEACVLEAAPDLDEIAVAVQLLNG